MKNKPMDPDLHKTLRLHGMYFGYPKCCIDAFITQSYNNKWPRKLAGTGYVPCDACNELPEDEIIRSINAKRIEPKRFPEMTTEEEWEQLERTGSWEGIWP